MASVTDEQIQEARKISLLDYFQSTDPAILRHKGGGRYVHKDHDSFVIDNGKGQFFWNSRGIGGASSLGKLCLFKLEGVLIDSDLCGLLNQCIEQAIVVLADGLHKNNEGDFIREFSSYWCSLP